jgi:DNA-binding IclR family transcriptional regulator
MARTGGRQRSSGAHVQEESDLFVRALARGLSILALFDVEHSEWGLAEVCERTGMSKTTAYRMLRTLEASDFLVYEAKTERYHLGSAAIPGAYLALSSVGFVRSAHPFLEKLAETTGETVELTVGAAEGAVVVDEVATTHPFRLNRPTGRIMTSLANSSFRMHIAFRLLAEQRRIVTTTRLPGDRKDPAAQEEMLRRLASDKSEGLSFDDEEQDPRVCAVSAPVLEPDGSLKAVLTLVAPAERFGPRERKKKTDACKATAAAMTEHLSGRSTASG